jgi:hypothetical protein
MMAGHVRVLLDADIFTFFLLLFIQQQQMLRGRQTNGHVCDYRRSTRLLRRVDIQTVGSSRCPSVCIYSIQKGEQKVLIDDTLFE